jgi:hypothetical protein
MKWDQSIERLCARYCDESQVREALHRKQYFFYKRSLTWFQLPIIVLSACSASVQFLSQSFPKHESTIVTCTATLSICVSIISSVMTYLGLGENKSKNEAAEISWQAFYNTISHQLSLKREHREDPEKFLAEVKLQYQRLFELSPMVGRSFVKDVKNLIKKNSTINFQVPAYLNGYHHTEIWEDTTSFEDNSLCEEVKLDVPEV